MVMNYVSDSSLIFHNSYLRRIPCPCYAATRVLRLGSRSIRGAERISAPTNGNPHANKYRARALTHNSYLILHPSNENAGLRILEYPIRPAFSTKRSVQACPGVQPGIGIESHISVCLLDSAWSFRLYPHVPYTGLFTLLYRLQAEPCQKMISLIMREIR